MRNETTPAEIARLMHENAAALELYASQWVNSPEDCVQEAFIELAKQQGKPANVIGWLYRVVRNKALNACRATNRRTNHERLAAMLISAISPERRNDEDHEELNYALDSLSHELRELIVLRIWSRLTWKQIAELTESSTSSVQRNYVSGLKKLKEILEPSCQKNLDCRQN